LGFACFGPTLLVFTFGDAASAMLQTRQPLHALPPMTELLAENGLLKAGKTMGWGGYTYSNR